MNSPASPTVDLANLGSLATLEGLEKVASRTKKKARGRSAAPSVAALCAAAGVVVWRLASIENDRRRRRATLRNAWLAGGVGLAALGVAAWQLQRLFVAETVHAVEMRSGALEVRLYPAVRIAETTVEGHWDDALNEGFLRLAAFIFGGNKGAQKIAMTSPVLGSGDAAGFRVAFVMPDGVTPTTPDDPRVALGELPPRRVAVLRFNGGHDATTIEAHKRELAHALAENGLHPRGEVSFAGYDPPSTLPLLRRNELWVELEEPLLLPSASV
jgi:SOUL heme-binding protein